MGNFVFPQEVIEKILSFVDGETLLSCQKVSPQFAAAVLYLTTKGIWKKCCRNEIVAKSTILQIISKLYPHTEGFNHVKNWKLIYECWSSISKIITLKKWNVTILKLGNKYSEICDIFIHGSLILVLLKYNKDFSFYRKIKTINDMNVIVNKSRPFSADSVYVTPIEDSKFSHDAISLYCKVCKLIGIPNNSSSKHKIYPKIQCDSNKITVEHCNGVFLSFNNTSGLYGRSKCISVGKESCSFEHTAFLNVLFEFSHLYIACDDVHREFCTIQSLHAKVTCAKSYANIILLGTDTGMLYGYFYKDKYDILELELKNYTWCFNVSSEPLLAVDVMIRENHFSIVCCNNKIIYQLTISS